MAMLNCVAAYSSDASFFAQTLDVLTVFGRSSTNNTNNIGPCRDPYGTLDVTGNSREVNMYQTCLLFNQQFKASLEQFYIFNYAAEGQHEQTYRGFQLLHR